MLMANGQMPQRAHEAVHIVRAVQVYFCSNVAYILKYKQCLHSMF